MSETLYTVYYAGVLMAVCTTHTSAEIINKRIVEEEELDDDSLVEIYQIIADEMIDDSTEGN